MSLIGDAPFWEYFEEICSIPHGSGNTDEISEYLVNFAKEQGLKYVKDELNNVVIYKSATEGYENKPAVILQGHMDMVAVKTKDCVKDLEKDGLDLEINDEWISAVGTSLGGDDGIAVAYMLAILASKDYKHPALECVITVDEEVGMDGAFGIKAEQLLKGTRMMNMDNEGEGVFLAGCAGGARIDCSIPVERKLRDAIVYELKVSGLKGGHSGVEINDNRVSAATIIARFLCELKLGRTRLIDIKCGEKDNVIANSGYIKFICSAPKPDVMEILDFYADVLKEELATREPGLKLEYECLGNEINVNALNRATSDKVMDFLLALPQGVDTMSADVPDLVETSDNIGIIDLTENELKCSVSVRSSYASAKQALCDKVIAVATLAGGTAKQLGDYPGWAYRVDSPLRDIMVEAYKEMYGKEPKVEAIHAGVECGLFIEKLEGLDCVSYGPDIEAIHSVNEHLNIPSAERVYDFTVKVLERS
jgi:dipeptidase D